MEIWRVSEEKIKGKTQRSQLRSVSVMFMSWALTDGFNYSAAALQFHCLSMAGQVFFRKIASLVYLLSSSPLNYCWYLFHQISSLSLELWLSPFLPPHILSLNKHPLKKKKKAKKISALHFCLTSHTLLLTIPQTQMEGLLGPFHRWLFPKIFFL